jgi:glycosyltransferase involved in cell wall biosynthesis
MSRLICHLIDTNRDTSYFNSIGRLHDRERFPVAIGSISPAGELQQAMGRLKVTTFSLQARRRWHYPAALLRLVRLIRRHRVALLHAHCFDPTVLGLLAARISGVGFVFTRHHSDHHIRLGKDWHTRVDAWCARHSDTVIAVSQATRRIMEEIEHVPGESITVVHNGMEPLPPPSVLEVERLRSDLGVNGAQICLTPARLHEEKGQLVLFEAIGEVRKRVGNAIFLLAGEGSHRELFEKEVQRRGLEGRVRFLGQRSDMGALLAVATIVVVPSLAESFGFSVLEAMSFGKPVVASSAGGITELISDGKDGLLVPPRDAAALASANSRLLEQPALARRLGEKALERAGAFSFERMIRGYEAVYKRVLDLEDL